MFLTKRWNSDLLQSEPEVAHNIKAHFVKQNKMGQVFVFREVSFVAFTSIKDHIRLDVTGCQVRKELMQQAGKSIIISSVLLVQKVVKVEAEVEAATVDDQATVSESHVLENTSVFLHEGGQPWDSHEASRVYGNNR